MWDDYYYNNHVFVASLIMACGWCWLCICRQGKEERWCCECVSVGAGADDAGRDRPCSRPQDGPCGESEPCSDLIIICLRRVNLDISLCFSPSCTQGLPKTRSGKILRGKNIEKQPAEVLIVLILTCAAVVVCCCRDAEVDCGREGVQGDPHHREP